MASRAWMVRDRFGVDAMAIVDREAPPPGPGEVAVRVRATSLNYRDLMVVEGKYNPKQPLPLVPLSDGVGEVTAVGPGVTRIAVGERVCGCFLPYWLGGEPEDATIRPALGASLDGVLAETVVLSAEGVVRVPEHLTDHEAATLPCAAVTAWHALVADGKLKAGDTVLVLGTGGVSMFALQFALLHGARVIVTSSSGEKLERAKAMGASDGVNYRERPDWEKAVREITGKRGVDHVVEVGGAGTLERSLQAVRVGGRVSVIGVLSGAAGGVAPVPVLMRNLTVQGVHVGSRQMFEAMNRAIGQHRMRPVVDRVFGFEEARDAMEYLRSGAHFGKVVVKVE